MNITSTIFTFSLAFCLLFFPNDALFGQTGTLLSHQKVSDIEGGFTGTLANSDRFGIDVSPIGDLDGDGVTDLVVGSDGSGASGSVWILFMNSDGTVKAEQQITEGVGGFTGDLNSGDDFGYSVTNLGDLNGDSITDIAVGSEEDDDGGSFRLGSVWIIFLDTDGTAKGQQKISATQGSFTGDLDNGDRFGSDVEGLGDWDGDGKPDLAVGAIFDDDGGSNHGALWILYLNADGTVKSHGKISDTSGGFTGTLSDGDYLGGGIANLGDINGDTYPDLAVGAELDDDGSSDAGAVWIMFTNGSGSVSSYQKISATSGGMPFGIAGSDFFGISVSAIGDIDNDDVMDIAVGSSGDDSWRGSYWNIMLNPSGTVKAAQKVGRLSGGFTGTLDFNDFFGNNVHGIGDLDGDGKQDVAVCASYDDDGGSDRGSYLYHVYGWNSGMCGRFLFCQCY